MLRWLVLAAALVTSSCSGAGGDDPAIAATTSESAPSAAGQVHAGPGFGVADGGLAHPGFVRVGDATWMFGGVRDGDEGWEVNGRGYLYSDDGAVLRTVDVALPAGLAAVSPQARSLPDGTVVAVADGCPVSPVDAPICTVSPTPLVFVLDRDGIERVELPGEWGQALAPAEGESPMGSVRLSGVVGSGVLLTRNVGPGPTGAAATFEVRAAVVDVASQEVTEVPVNPDVAGGTLVCGVDDAVYSAIPVVDDDVALRAIQIVTQRAPDWRPTLRSEVDGFASTAVLGGSLLCSDEVVLVHLFARPNEVIALDPSSGQPLVAPMRLGPGSLSIAPSADGDGFVIVNWNVDGDPAVEILRVRAEGPTVELGTVALAGGRIKPYVVDLGDRVAEVSGWAAFPGIDRSPTVVG